MVVQPQQRALEIDKQREDDLIEAGELTTQELVYDEMHAGEGDECAQQGKVPTCDEDLHLHVLAHQVGIQVERQPLQLVHAPPRDQVAHRQVLQQDLPEALPPHHPLHDPQRLLARPRVVNQCRSDEVHALHVPHLAVHPRVPHQHLPQAVQVLWHLEGSVLRLRPRQVLLDLPQRALPLRGGGGGRLRWEGEVWDGGQPPVHPDAPGTAVTASALRFYSVAEVPSQVALGAWHLLEGDGVSDGFAASDGLLEIRVFEADEEFGLRLAAELVRVFKGNLPPPVSLRVVVVEAVVDRAQWLRVVLSPQPLSRLLGTVVAQLVTHCRLL